MQDQNGCNIQSDSDGSTKLVEFVGPCVLNHLAAAPSKMKYNAFRNTGRDQLPPHTMRILEAFLTSAFINSCCYGFHVGRFPSRAAARIMPLRTIAYKSDQLFSKAQSRAKLLSRLSMTTTSWEQANEECKQMSVRDIKVTSIRS